MTPLEKSELAHKLFDQAKQDKQLPESARMAFVMGVLAGLKEAKT